MKKLKAVGSVLLYLAIYLACNFVTTIVLEFAAAFGISFDAAKTGEVDFESVLSEVTVFINENATLITLISNVLFVLIVVVVFLIRKKNFFAETGILKPDPRFIIPAALAGFSANIIMVLILTVIPFPESWWSAYDTSSAAVGNTDVITVLAVVIGAPVAEEILFRGLIFTRVSRGFGVIAGGVVSSLVFGLMHGQIIWMIYTFILGILLSVVFYKTRSLIFTMITHLTFNITGYIVEEVKIWMVIMSVIALAASLFAIFFFSAKTKRLEEEAAAVNNGENGDQQ